MRRIRVSPSDAFPYTQTDTDWVLLSNHCWLAQSSCFLRRLLQCNRDSLAGIYWLRITACASIFISRSAESIVCVCVLCLGCVPSWYFCTWNFKPHTWTGWVYNGAQKALLFPLSDLCETFSKQKSEMTAFTLVDWSVCVRVMGSLSVRILYVFGVFLHRHSLLHFRPFWSQMKLDLSLDDMEQICGSVCAACYL